MNIRTYWMPKNSRDVIRWKYLLDVIVIYSQACVKCCKFIWTNNRTIERVLRSIKGRNSSCYALTYALKGFSHTGSSKGKGTTTTTKRTRRAKAKEQQHQKGPEEEGGERVKNKMHLGTKDRGGRRGRVACALFQRKMPELYPSDIRSRNCSVTR